MIIIPGRIPISIHPFFWVLAGLIGYLNSQTVIGTLIWMGIIVLSVLFHEYGHALTAAFFRQKAQIQLVALGGLTTFEGPKLKFWQQFIIVLNGPLAGILLFIIATFCLLLPLTPALQTIIAKIQMVNLFWSIINLLPVLPLDGGQLFRIALEGFFGVKGFKASLLIGMIFAIILSFYFFLIDAFLIGAFFFLFAFQSFDMWRKSRLVTLQDREDEYKKMLTQGEIFFKEGQKVEAQQLFEEIRQKAGGGLLAALASQYLAFLYADQGKRNEAYELLVPCKEQLEGAALILLHELAFENNNHAIVAELSSDAYQFAPSQEVALRNAKSFARLGQPQPAGGWLQTAAQLGSFDLKMLLQDEAFSKVRNDPRFVEFVDRLL